MNKWNPDPVRYFTAKELEGMPGYLPGWYHYDETWSDLSERYDTEAEAREGLLEYCRIYLGVTATPKE